MKTSILKGILQALKTILAICAKSKKEEAGYLQFLQITRFIENI
jgi:hypothetical protein